MLLINDKDDNNINDDNNDDDDDFKKIPFMSALIQVCAYAYRMNNNIVFTQVRIWMLVRTTNNNTLIRTIYILNSSKYMKWGFY